MGGTVAGVGVTALGLGLEGPRGWAFRGVSFEAEPGSLITIEGPSGTGRTCLLLALTGRMKSTEGTASVGGTALPKRMAAVRRVSAVAHVPGVTDLEPALTVAEHLHERALLQRRFGDSLRGLLRPRAERKSEERLRIDAALKAAGLDLASLPKGSRTAVRDLERPEALRLSLALALIGRPQLLGVDDTDLKLSDAERAEIWALLKSVAENGTTVVAVCSEAPAGTVVVSTGPTEPAEPGEPTAPTDATDEAPASRDAQENVQEDVQESDGKEAADALAEAGRA
ncbi:ATP-binding cassette domain-containing protein [Streptomyces chartreusis]|uniref:ATP-binding cassette domain-containing protein n=1 Tax=Streptomyces chartreusis TaxID=1969 RepID=UPI003869720A|nr:ATP-binding cassette domain-containing protein [Streptomyces chartreusis]WTA26737.1 ATP-binding cassette domain-containing protein [Streptomyces chartreusis]